GGRLAIRRRHERAAVHEPRAERLDRSGVEPEQQLPGRARGTAASQTRERANGPRQRELDAQRPSHQAPVGLVPAASLVAGGAPWLASSVAPARENGEGPVVARGTSIVTAPCSARTRTGSSPIGSPSA